MSTCMSFIYRITEKQSFLMLCRLGEISFFLKISEEERKTSKHASVTVSVTFERQTATSSFLPTPTLLAARCVVASSSWLQSRLHAYFFCILPHGFLGKKRDCFRSLEDVIWKQKVVNSWTDFRRAREVTPLLPPRIVRGLPVFQAISHLPLACKHSKYLGTFVIEILPTS